MLSNHGQSRDASQVALPVIVWPGAQLDGAGSRAAWRGLGQSESG